MKKLSYFLILLFAASVIFTGCRQNDDPIMPYDEPIVVNLRTNIPARTRVVNNQWQTNDQIGFFMVEAGQPLSNASIVNNNHNVLMTIENGALTPNRPVLYPMRGNVGFIAYFPFQNSVGSNFTIPVTVGDQSAGLPTEVLFSNNITNQAPTQNPVTLDFQYSLAKLEIRVIGGANSTLTEADFQTMTASIEGVYTQANLQLTNGTFANHSGKQTVGLHRTGNNATSTSFEALVLPSDNEITFVFNIGGAIYRTQPMTADFVAANLHRLNFTLNFPFAALSNAVIIPREVNPPKNIDVDAVPSVNPSVIRAENVVLGDYFSDREIVTVKAGVWSEGGFLTLVEAPFQNNSFTLQLDDVPESFLYLIDRGDGEYAIFGFANADMSDRNARGAILPAFLGFDSDENESLGFGLASFGLADVAMGNVNEVVWAVWIYVDRDVTISGTDKNEYMERTWDLNFRKGWNIYYMHGSMDTMRIAFTTQRPANVNLRWNVVAAVS